MSLSYKQDTINPKISPQTPLPPPNKHSKHPQKSNQTDLYLKFNQKPHNIYIWEESLRMRKGKKCVIFVRYSMGFLDNLHLCYFDENYHVF